VACVTLHCFHQRSARPLAVQSISFNPSAHVPHCHQSVNGAADIRATIQGTNLRISAASGSFAGKDILLLNVAPTLGLQHRHRQPSRLGNPSISAAEITVI
jgi:hypothetical protein